MRDIKFRAWDNDAGEYAYSEEESEYYAWGFDKGKVVCYAIITEYPSDPMEAPYPSSVELEPPETFTGLQDKNGKDIYEGDILKKIRLWKRVVFWNDEMSAWGYHSYFKYDFKGDGLFLNIDESAFEIIGNIHEPTKEIS